MWQEGVRCVGASVLDDSVGKEGGIHLAIYLSSFRGGLPPLPAQAHDWSRKCEMLVRGKMRMWKTARYFMKGGFQIGYIPNKPLFLMLTPNLL